MTGCLITIGTSAFAAEERDSLVRTWSLKNNLLYDATLTPNLGVEVAVGDRSSLQLFYGWNPWRGYHGRKSLRHWSLMPEYRYWLTPRKDGESQRRVFEPGWFTGVHLVGGEYNVGGVKFPLGLFPFLHDNRYEGWYAGGGLTLGHLWRLSERWNLEAAIGVGYIHFKYDKYENVVCGRDLGSGHYNYVGPTKLALNIAYSLGRKVKIALPPPPVIEVKEVYQPQYQTAYVTPVAEAEKTRQLSGRAFLDFVVNKTDIRPSYRRNADELAKVVQTIDVVRQDSFATITGISIHGYASPEGSYSNNVRLAEGRAKAFADYVQGLISLPGSVVAVQSTPEDWQGLRDYIIGQPDLSILLPIVDDTSLDPDQKERQMKNRYPQQWRYLLDNVMPALRHSDYEVAYTIRPFSIEEAKAIIRTKPQHLSLNEMFLVANTYPVGSEDYDETFLTAVRMYPADQTANLNAAVISLNRGDLTAAEHYLQKAGNSAEAQNARALLAIRQNRLDEAERLLQQSTLPQAQHNLNELRKYINSLITL